MSSLAMPQFPHMMPRHSTHAGARLIPQLLCSTIVAFSMIAYLTETPWVIWVNLIPAFWLAVHSPQSLVALLLLLTPIFPVLRVADETLGSREVSSRGLFLAADDPIVVALVAVWVWRRVSRTGRTMRLFPGSLLGLLAVYPAVVAANLLRLEWQQSLMSFLYYAKWAEYALLLYVIPGLIPLSRLNELLRGARVALSAGAVASAGFAVYEVTESIRTHTYSQAALYPRASSFFGTLDPARFGASEDPVNFGCYLIVAGSIALAFSRRMRTAAGGTLAAAAAFTGVLLSVSRAPLLGAAFAYCRLQRLRTGKTLLSLVGLAVAGVLAALLFPEISQTVLDRFTMIVPTAQSVEGSASDRLQIVMNSPVFEIDTYWLIGHGHSSYRFVSEQHLASFMGRVSRSLYNFPMTVWYDAGLLGLLLWTALFVQLNRYLRQAAARAVDPVSGALAEGLRAGMWGLLVASMFSEVPYNWRVMGFFYCATGVCLAVLGPARSTRQNGVLGS
jgi:hypothetical protein